MICQIVKHILLGTVGDEISRVQQYFQTVRLHLFNEISHPLCTGDNIQNTWLQGYGNIILFRLLCKPFQAFQQSLKIFLISICANTPPAWYKAALCSYIGNPVFRCYFHMCLKICKVLFQLLIIRLQQVCKHSNGGDFHVSFPIIRNQFCSSFAGKSGYVRPAVIGPIFCINTGKTQFCPSKSIAA